MTTIVIMPGGFHPFHAGHYALYQSARRTFPDAEVYVAATNDTSTRPFPFPVKEKLAKLAGVEPGHFVQVKSPFKAEEITAKFDPSKDQLIFVRSEKDSTKPPQPGGIKKDGSPAYLQPLLGAKRLEPFAKHAYMAYLPTVEFGPGMTSATEIRNEWPTLDEQGKLDRVMSLYPRTQGNARLAATVVGLLDAAIGGEVTESTGDRPHDPASVKEFISNKHLVKFTPTAIEIYYGGDLVLSKPGDFSNPTRQDVYNARRYTTDLFNKKLKQQQLANLVSKGVAEGATVTRIDSKPITDFASGLKAYKHTDDWSQSGVDTGDDSYWKNKNLKTSTTKGLFAGDPRRTALYATGNAHETRYVEFTLDGQPIVYFDKKDLPAMRNRKTYLTVFDADNFKQLPTGEWFSENPGKPIKQMPIGDPFKYIADQGWIVRVTDDLDKVFKQVKKMHQAGKIAQYGAEGMNESKHGVAETSKQKGVVGREYDRDPELRQAMLYAKQHYPQHANDPEQAMLKWLQRGLNHSEQEDRQHDRRLAQLNSKVSALIASITQLKQQQSQSANENNDYVDE